MYAFTNTHLVKISKDPNWGHFIEPDHELEQLKNPLEKYAVAKGSAYTPHFEPYYPFSPEFKRVGEIITEARKNFKFEDECSERYYFQIFQIVQALLAKKQCDRIIDVGVYMGGSANIIAGCLENNAADLVLIDPSMTYLRMSYERIRRTYKDVAKKTRLFFGDLPTYVHNVMIHEKGKTNLVHHDGSHHFIEVLKDLAAMSFVKEKIQGLIIQDTHLRSNLANMHIFVDAALYAVFGTQMKAQEIGMKLLKSSAPDSSGYGLYFLENQPEGMYIPFNQNTFRYPHPSMELKSLLYYGEPSLTTT